MSEAIKEFQKKIGANPDGDFGKETLVKAKAFYKLSNEQTANFFGQCYHETGGFKVGVENTNYSAERMLQIFKSDFDVNKDRVLSSTEKDRARALAGNSVAIANYVYQNQNGNGNEASGDGDRYRGRGSLQTTGRANYKAFADFIKDQTIMSNPSQVAVKYYFESALFFFAKNSLWDIAKSVSRDSITKLTKRINGGVNGLEERVEATMKFYGLLIK